MKKTPPSTVRILGAGPAGLSAALTLRQRGVDAEIFEKNSDCGTRFRGDLQGIDNFSCPGDFLEELGAQKIQADFACTPLTSLIGVDPDGKQFTLGNKSTIVYLVRRGTAPDTIDTCLKNQALDAGVRIHFNAGVSEDDVDLVATGPPKKAVRGIGYGMSFETDHPDSAYVVFDNRLGYHGYAYLLTAGGRGCLFTILLDRFPQAKKQFDLARDALVEMSGVNVRNPTLAGAVGTYSPAPRYRTGSRLYAGEASGLQDPLWGFGIRYAIQSGRLAAESFLGEVDYEREARRRFDPRVRTGIVNRWLYETGGHIAYRHILQRAWDSGDFRSYLHRLFNPGLKTFLSFPLACHLLKRKHRARRNHKAALS